MSFEDDFEEYEAELASNNTTINEESETTCNLGDVKSDCKHESIVKEANNLLCSDCGIELWKIISYEKEWRKYENNSRDPTRCYARKPDEKNIFTDVESFGFPKEIVNNANILYENVTNGKIYRGNSRLAVVFACLFHVIKTEGGSLASKYTCETLRGLFKLDRKLVLKGLKIVSMSSYILRSNIPKIQGARTKYITAIEFINEFIVKYIDHIPAEELKLHTANIIDLSEKIRLKNKNSIINKSRPQSIAISLIYQHFKKDINIKEFCKKTNLSEITVNKLTKEIDKLV